MAGAPRGLDLTFLSEQEARQISQVLERDAELRRAERDRVSKELFLTLEPIPSTPSQGGLLDHDTGEGTSGANVSTNRLSTPSQRLAQIRRWKKRTWDDMFAKLMQSSRTDRAQLNAWRQTIVESCKVCNECNERRDMRN